MAKINNDNSSSFIIIVIIYIRVQCMLDWSFIFLSYRRICFIAKEVGITNIYIYEEL